MTNPHETLVALLEELAKLEPEAVPFEVAKQRFKHCCDQAHSGFNAATSQEKPVVHRLFHFGVEHHATEGLAGAVSGIYLGAFAELLEDYEEEHPDIFQTRFHKCLHEVMTRIAGKLQETHETSTKPSTQNGSTEPPETSG